MGLARAALLRLAGRGRPRASSRSAKRTVAGNTRPRLVVSDFFPAGRRRSRLSCSWMGEEASADDG